MSQWSKIPARDINLQYSQFQNAWTSPMSEQLEREFYGAQKNIIESACTVKSDEYCILKVYPQHTVARAYYPSQISTASQPNLMLLRSMMAGGGNTDPSSTLETLGTDESVSDGLSGDIPTLSPSETPSWPGNFLQDGHLCLDDSDSHESSSAVSSGASSNAYSVALEEEKRVPDYVTLAHFSLFDLSFKQTVDVLLSITECKGPVEGVPNSDQWVRNAHHSLEESLPQLSLQVHLCNAAYPGHAQIIVYFFIVDFFCVLTYQTKNLQPLPEHESITTDLRIKTMKPSSYGIWQSIWSPTRSGDCEWMYGQTFKVRFTNSIKAAFKVAEDMHPGVILPSTKISG